MFKKDQQVVLARTEGLPAFFVTGTVYQVLSDQTAEEHGIYVDRHYLMADRFDSLDVEGSNA